MSSSVVARAKAAASTVIAAERSIIGTIAPNRPGKLAQDQLVRSVRTPAHAPTPKPPQPSLGRQVATGAALGAAGYLVLTAALALVCPPAGLTLGTLALGASVGAGAGALLSYLFARK